MRYGFLTIIILFFTHNCFSQEKEIKQLEKSKPFSIGIIEEITSKELNENRILNIYLPEGYKNDDTSKYGVIYLLDGSADEDFIHIVGLVQFNSFEWIKRMPKTIVVGIATVDRKRDYTNTSAILKERMNYPTSGHSKQFIDFIENELQPFIDKKYNTNNSKTIIGQSLGGLLATEILLKRPHLFNKYCIISPSIWWDNGSILNYSPRLLESTYTQPTKIYIGVGKEGLSPTDQPHVMEVDANLLADKLKSINNQALNIFFDYLPQENHATILHQAVANAIKLIY